MYANKPAEVHHHIENAADGTGSCDQRDGHVSLDEPAGPVTWVGEMIVN